jgi:hypothetical protein
MQRAAGFSVQPSIVARPSGAGKKSFTLAYAQNPLKYTGGSEKFCPPGGSDSNGKLTMM